MDAPSQKSSESDQSLIFDDYFKKYNSLMEKNLRILTPAGNIGYFASHKMSILRNLIKANPEQILEYGCGIGNNLSPLKNFFPSASIWGCDTSEKSIEMARQKHPDIHFFLISNKTYPDVKFDCILVSDVIHHIPEQQRNFYLETILDFLKPTGTVVFFEHNPYNPLTRLLVSTCPFDKNAELISLRNMRNLLITKGLVIRESRYCFFFPEFLQYLDCFENRLSWLPLGGKYYVLAEKNP